MRIEVITGKNIAKHIDARSSLNVTNEELAQFAEKVLKQHPCPIIAGYKGDSGIVTFVGADFIYGVYFFMKGFTRLPNGLLFNQLTEDEQDLFNELQIPIVVYKQISDTKIVEIVTELNRGSQIHEAPKVEKTDKAVEHAVEITKPTHAPELNALKVHPFFSSTAIPEITNEIVLAMMILFDKGVTDISKKTLDDYVQQGNLIDISKELDYLALAFPEKTPFLKKINLPMILFMTKDLMETKNPYEFAEAISRFYANPTDVYKKACDSGTASKSNVSKRVDELAKFLKEAF